MSNQMMVSQDERVMAGLAHGSVLLAPITNGIGGVMAALVIWLTQREKSRYVAYQALQALVYQVATFVLVGLCWCCWGIAWMLLLLPPIFANPEAYNNAPPAGMWVGLSLMVVPLAAWAVTVLYGVWAAVQTLRGREFKYAIIGNWLKSQG